MATAIAAASRRVLLIEDNVDAAETMQMLLELYGHSVRVAHAGASGIEVARSWAPEVVVSDIGLPGDLDGFGVARQLREDGWSGLLVALSGYGLPQDRQRSYAAGFDGHLTKPVEISVLNELIARVQVPAGSFASFGRFERKGGTASSERASNAPPSASTISET